MLTYYLSKIRDMKVIFMDAGKLVVQRSSEWMFGASVVWCPLVDLGGFV